MWSLRTKDDGTFYLTFDRSRRYTYNLRGEWVWICSSTAVTKGFYIQMAKMTGHLVAEDDEGGVRALVLED